MELSGGEGSPFDVGSPESRGLKARTVLPEKALSKPGELDRDDYRP